MLEQEYITQIDQYVIDYVKKIRSEKKLTQQDIANIIGISREYIKLIESKNSRAKYNIRHINSLADYFGISPKDFLPAKAFPVENNGKEITRTVKRNTKSKKTVKKKDKK
jgi:transcriptional regulator with XRE-family HTH domain